MLAEELGRVMQRVYDSDPKRFHGLIKWRNLYLKLGRQDEERHLVTEGEAIEMVTEALKRFEKVMAKIEGLWWGYLSAIYNKVRAERIQSQSAKYKSGGGGLSSLAEVLEKAGLVK